MHPSIDPWARQVAMLAGTPVPAPRSWGASRRHVVSEFAGSAPQPLPRPALAAPDGAPADAAVGDAELLALLRHAGPLSVPQVALRLGIDQPRAWERLHLLRGLGLARRDAGAWAAARPAMGFAPRPARPAPPSPVAAAVAAAPVQGGAAFTVRTLPRRPLRSIP